MGDNPVLPAGVGIRSGRSLSRGVTTRSQFGVSAVTDNGVPRHNHTVARVGHLISSAAVPLGIVLVMRKWAFHRGATLEHSAATALTRSSEERAAAAWIQPATPRFADSWFEAERTVPRATRAR